MILERLFPERRNGSTAGHPSSWFVDWITGGRKTLSGVDINAETALTTSAIWRGISLLAGDVAKTPIYLYRRQGAGKVIADNHPAYSLVRRTPNPWMTAFDFKRTLTANAILTGNGYAWIDQMDGQTILRHLPPSQTYAHSIVGREVIYLTAMEGHTYAIPSTQMLHIRNLSWDGISGLGVVDKAKEAIGLTIAAERFGAAFFGNSARPNVAIKYPTTLTPEKKNDLREAWERAYRGIKKSNGVAVLEGGIELQEFGATNEQMQFLATREFQIRDIANWIGVPPHMLGDTTRTAYASIEQENKSYLQVSLDYWMTAWEEELYRKLLSDSEQQADTLLFEFLRKRLISMDAKTEQEVIALQLTNGTLTLDEARAMDNRDPLPDGRGDTHRMPLNLGIIGEDGIPVAKAATVPAPGDLLDDPPAKDEDGDEQEEGDDDEPEEPAESEEEENDRTMAVLVEAVARAIRRVGHAAIAAAKKPAGFLDWLDRLRTDKGEATYGTLLTPLWAASRCGREQADRMATEATDTLLERVRADLLEASGTTTRDGLAGVVAERMTALELSAATIAAELVKGTNDA